MTLADFRLQRFRPAMMKLLAAGVAALLLWWFGALDAFDGKISAAVAALSAFTLVFATAFIWNISQAAAAIQRDADAEITALRKQLDDKAEREEALSALWRLRTSGVELRNEELTSAEDVPSWVQRVDVWRIEVLSKAEKANVNLKEYLATLDQMHPGPAVRTWNAEHMLRIRIMSEMLQRLQLYLSRELR